MSEIEHVEYPKWVEPHESHIATDQGGNKVVQGFAESFWDRVSQKFTVLVHDADGEDKALAAKDEPKVEDSADEKPTELTD
jgi:hypothetical protein